MTVWPSITASLRAGEMSTLCRRAAGASLRACGTENDGGRVGSASGCAAALQAAGYETERQYFSFYFDRVLASKMGIAAVEGLLEGRMDVMVGVKDNRIVYNDFNTIMTEKYHEIDPEALRIAKILSI